MGRKSRNVPKVKIEFNKEALLPALENIRALKKAKSKLSDEYDIQQVESKIQSSKIFLDDQVSRALEKLPLSKNYLPLDNGWYGVRHQGGKGMCLEILPLTYAGVQRIERNCKIDPEITTEEIREMQPNIIDPELWNEHWDVVEIKADRMLEENGYSEDKSEADKKEVREEGFVVGHHSRKRWVERKLKLNSKDMGMSVDQYVRENKNDLNEDIMNHYKNATEFWYEPEDDVRYMFDEDNMMYVVSPTKMYTVYEINYGFAKSINRNIALEQRSVIEDTFNELLSATDEYDEVKESTSADIEALENEIRTLQSKIDLLHSSVKSAKAKDKEAEAGLAYHKSRYVAECDKVFKKKEVADARAMG